MFRGRFVELEPLSAHHVEAVVSAVGADRSTYEWIDVPATADDVHKLLAAFYSQPQPHAWMPFVQKRVKDSAVLGMTNYVGIERWNGPDAHPTTVEIANSWLNPQALHSPIDTESKLLLCTHAFEEWQVVRVQIRTDARNERSRRALTRIGAQLEGVLRNAQQGSGDIGRGGPRDSAIFSIIPEHWPNVKAGLIARLG